MADTEVGTIEASPSKLVKELVAMASSGDANSCKVLHDLLIDEGQDQLAGYLHHCIYNSSCKGMECNVIIYLASGMSYNQVIVECCRWHPT